MSGKGKERNNSRTFIVGIESLMLVHFWCGRTNLSFRELCFVRVSRC